MRALFAASLLILGAQGAFLSGPALAEGPKPIVPLLRDDTAPEPPEARTGEAKPGDTKSGESKPTAEADPVKRLDALFAALKAAPTKESAKLIADRIDIALLPSESDTADLLMSRAAQATEAKDFDLAIRLLDGVISAAPDHLEAWNKRATVFYLKQDYSDSLRDLQQVVAREPRHYGAWAGIALICKDVGDDKHALEAVRRALEIYPQLDSMKEMEKELSLKVEGRPI